MKKSYTLKMKWLRIVSAFLCVTLLILSASLSVVAADQTLNDSTTVVIDANTATNSVSLVDENLLFTLGEGELPLSQLQSLEP
ncbi:MAG: hypothetical protein E7643_00095 [Ruminococcaceae bacterium]|nr:hypothetical protein [Oscillospiraceae bacterium]